MADIASPDLTPVGAAEKSPIRPKETKTGLQTGLTRAFRLIYECATSNDDLKFKNMAGPTRDSAERVLDIIAVVNPHLPGAEKITGQQFNPDTGEYFYKFGDQEKKGLFTVADLYAYLEAVANLQGEVVKGDAAASAAKKAEAKTLSSLLQAHTQVTLIEPGADGQTQTQILSYDNYLLKKKGSGIGEKTKVAFTLIYQLEIPTAPTETTIPAEISPEVDKVNQTCNAALDGQIETTLRAALRGDKEADWHEAQASLFYRAMEATPENAKAVASLKLLRLQELGQTDLDVPVAWKDQTVLRGHLADFVNGQLKQAGIEGLTQAEQKLLVESSLDINRLLTGLTPGQMQNVLEGGRVESITEGISDPDIKAAFQTLAAKFAKPEVAALINNSLFAHFRPEEIIREVKQKLGEEFEKAKPGWLEQQVISLKNLPTEIKKNPLLVILLLTQGQGFLTSLFTQMLPEEGR